MRKRVVLGLAFLAAVLWLLAGLRDIFAPGFFSMSPRVMGKSDIIIEFATAAIFFALAGLSASGRSDAYGINKK
jgi:hypothetical protein